MPVRFSNRSPTAFGKTAPPLSAIRTEATLLFPIGTSANAAMDVGTPLMMVALNRSTIRQ